MLYCGELLQHTFKHKEPVQSDILSERVFSQPNHETEQIGFTFGYTKQSGSIKCLKQAFDCTPAAMANDREQAKSLHKTY